MKQYKLQYNILMSDPFQQINVHKPKYNRDFSKDKKLMFSFDAIPHKPIHIDQKLFMTRGKRYVL